MSGSWFANSKGLNMASTPPKDKNGADAAAAMPFNEALKRVWAAPPMPHVKKKPAAKAANKKKIP